MIRLALWLLLWGYVIYANVNYRPETGPKCNYNLCPHCPFPCDDRDGQIFIEGEQKHD